MPLSAVDEYAETLMAQRISTVNGVAQVNVFGAQKFAVRVQLDPNLLAARGIGIDDVDAALQTHNVNLPTGTLWGAHQAFTVQANGQLNDRRRLPPIIVAYRNGSPVRLRDLGNVIDSVENDKIAGCGHTTRSVAFHWTLDSAPARHQYGGNGRPHQGVAAAVPRHDARRR